MLQIKNNYLNFAAVIALKAVELNFLFNPARLGRLTGFF